MEIPATSEILLDMRMKLEGRVQVDKGVEGARVIRRRFSAPAEAPAAGAAGAAHSPAPVDVSTGPAPLIKYRSAAGTGRCPRGQRPWDASRSGHGGVEPHRGRCRAGDGRTPGRSAA
ncbi:hypothetical protein GCM10009605_24480 [Nocardiopsis composta]